MRALLMIVVAMLALSGSAFAADKDGKAAAKAPAAAQKEIPDSEKLDLNTASAKDLDKLPGIGEARAKAIIKGRPYKAKDDLVERKIIPASVYEKIKDRIIARQGK
jgi:DNA uptake protein ComE-like DNA-binding protein